MALYRLLLAVVALASTTAARAGRPGYGLIGYGITMYDPACAYSCRSSVPMMLDCPDDGQDHSSMMMMEHAMPSPECLATNRPFLTTLAWCMHTTCAEPDVEMWKMEKYWTQNVAGRMSRQPEPEITYQEALDLVRDSPPTETLPEGEMLNRTVLVDQETWISNYNANVNFEQQEDRHSTYAIVIMSTCVVIPIFLSLLRFLPFSASFISTLKAYIVDPPAFGSYHAMPVLGLAIIPTRGQALFILYIIAVNTILSFAGIAALRPNSWFPTLTYEISALISNRVGILSFCNLPLLLLFAGRNNILLWLTNWSYNTFLLLHRWVAFISTIQACLHSAIYLGLYVGKGAHAEESKVPYWYWGIIGTLCMALIVPLSALPIRRVAYEFFLIVHILLSILALAGCWYHIIFRYGHQWGYETFLYTAFAVWAFDRILRLLRLLGNGVKTAYVTELDADYLKIHIPDAQCHGHVYVYFPGLSWKFWENHPFSVVGSVGCSNLTDAESPVMVSGDEQPALETKEAGNTVTASSASSTHRYERSPVGVTLFARRLDGMTAKLASAVGNPKGISVLMEASYSSEGASFLQEGHGAPSAEYPNTLCIAGGVGITGVLPSLETTKGLYRPLGTTKLYWCTRGQALVDAVDEVVPKSSWDNIERHVFVGERADLRDILQRELQSSGKGTTVVVCGPPSMADEVRCATAALGRHGATVRFVEESFSW